MEKMQLDWTCPHCGSSMDEEKLRRRGNKIAKNQPQTKLDNVTIRAECKACLKRVLISFTPQTTYIVQWIDKAPMLELV